MNSRPNVPPAAAAQDRRLLSAAIELSRRSPRGPDRYAVGAIVVDPVGIVLATGYTGENDPRHHAEEAALAKLADRRGTVLDSATLYSSLEPCTTRASRPKTCTELILDAGIRRVVFALREPLHFADCHGTELLRQGNVDVLEIDELGRFVGEINAHILGPAPKRPS
ncbi:deaminase [Micromonospora vulcania]|uniref:Deaminase n=1 Tax=Micromonospora vulcania TaxID=1441873 RepID=A0ABW1H221_9ACTN